MMQRLLTKLNAHLICYAEVSQLTQFNPNHAWMDPIHVQLWDGVW